MKTINLAEKFAMFAEHWQPRIIGELNGQHVKIAKLEGEFIWHSHAQEDELFMVISGRLRMEFRDSTQWIEAGEILIVPQGVEHRPVAEGEVQLLMFEPVGTLNTGDVESERTVSAPKQI